MVTLDRESRYQRELAEDQHHLVEANDISALRLLKGGPHSVGPFVNVYNGETARLLARNGATSICLPPELPATSVARITGTCTGPEFELFAFGRIPLALSARCAHARSKGKTKDNCQFVCQEDPDGLSVRTLSGQSFLALNGIQTVSHACQALLDSPEDLSSMGISSLRLSPQACDMVKVSEAFRALADRERQAAEVAGQLRAIYPDAPLANGFHHGEAGANWIARQRNSTSAS